MSCGISTRPWRTKQVDSTNCLKILSAEGYEVGLAARSMDGMIIVDAVNEQESLHKQLAAATADASAFRQERDGLRKQVAAYLQELVRRSSINEALGEALKRICDICGEAWDAPECDREAAMSKALNDIYELARDSRKEAAK